MRENRLVEFIIVITLIGMLMSVVIYYYLKSEAKISHVIFNTAAQKFTAKVNTVHAQWLMDNKPHKINVSMVNKTQSQLIEVNGQGWIDTLDAILPCELIWQQVIGTPLLVMKQPIIAINIQMTTKQQLVKKQLICRYLSSNGKYFDYNRSLGHVSAVKVIEQ